MALDPGFVADAPYGPGGLLIDEILRIDHDASVIVGRMPTHDELPLTREQRAHPRRHPRHVSGGLMVHMTGMIAFAHAYFLLGMRHADGWVGYGAKMHDARFASLAPPGEPLELECKGTRVKPGPHRMVARYAFRFTQAGRLVYEGDQTAIWTRLSIES